MLQVLRGIGENVEVLDRSAEASASSNTEMAAVNDGVAKQVADMARLAAEAATSVEEITSWTRQVAGTIEELTASVEATSASMSEMDAAIGEVEVNANETTKLSAAAAESSSEGVRAIQQTISGIDRIRQSSKSVAALIDSLGSRLSHIGDIVVVIDNVAGQTNLLALNAAIIASQAGEHGRGFAVVADEIKALATRTAASTQEIRSLIEGIEEESKKAVVAVEDTSHSVDEGVRLGGAAEQALQQIAAGTARATAMMKAIASSTVEQARASRQVTTAVHRIAETILRINNGARDQARSSERITETVTNLQSMSQSVLRSSEEQRKGASQIARSVETIGRMVKQLATAQREQTVGAEQVLRAVEAIKDVASGQSTAVRELESALAMLQRHAGTLTTAVQQFRS
jgi:methyl-accepting chemotaxis protein